MTQALGQALPIWDIHAEITDTLAVQNCLVLGAPTGSGKSTQVPQMILDDVLCGESHVVSYVGYHFKVKPSLRQET